MSIFMHVNVCSSKYPFDLNEFLLKEKINLSQNIVSTLTPICILVLSSHDLLITWLNLIYLCLVCDAITRSSNQTPEGVVSVSLPSRSMVTEANRAQLNCKTSSLTSLSSSQSQEKGKQPLCYERVVVFRVYKWFWFWL